MSKWQSLAFSGGEGGEPSEFEKDNPYYNPQAFGLAQVFDHERYGESYEFDLVVLWRATGGELFWGQDAGCSCPTPFEGATPRPLDSDFELRGLVEALRTAQYQKEQALVKIVQAENFYRAWKKQNEA